MLVHNPSHRGFFLLELLVAIVVLLTMLLLLAVPVQKYIDTQHLLQLKMAGQEFAADIRAAQQQSVFDNYSSNRVILLDNKEGYRLEATNDYIRFPEIGCEGVYIGKYTTNAIAFSDTGTPTNSTSGEYVLKHYKLSDKSVTITIHATTGRVDLSGP